MGDPIENEVDLKVEGEPEAKKPKTDNKLSCRAKRGQNKASKIV